MVTNENANSPAAALEGLNLSWGASAPPQAASPDERLWGMLANVLGLVFIIGPLVPYFLRAQSRYVRFYALQMVFLNIVGLLVGIVLGIALGILSIVPILPALISGVFGLAFLGLLIFLSVKAHQGVLFRLPAIGALAQDKTKG